MKKQQLFISFVLFVYFIQFHWIVAVHSNKIQTKNKNVSQIDSFPNCSEFENDEIVVTSDEFYVPLNPSNKFPKTYGSTYTNGRIFHLRIVNKKFIPSTVFRLIHLKRLDVQNTCFSPCNHRLPAEIECLASSLTELSIYDTKITHLPEQISKLTHLQALKLSNTGLTTLPDFIGSLSSLTMLYLPDNNLTSLPITIKNLRLLQQITLTNNPYLRSVQPLNDHPSLNTLNARYCAIENLPRNLPQLIDLYMSNNKLKGLTGIETLGNGTSSKKSFYFDKNYILSISPQIRHVRNLFRLSLNDNQLKTLPSDIYHITTLRDLFVENNPLNTDEYKKIYAKFKPKH